MEKNLNEKYCPNNGLSHKINEILVPQVSDTPKNKN